MKKHINKIIENKVFKMVRPWLSVIAILLILRYSGMLAGISSVTNAALMKTGVMDASTDIAAVTPSFDYNFAIRDMTGQIVPFSHFKGKTVFLNIWATWCGPCRYEMPSIQSLYDKVDKDKVVFVMLSVDKMDHTEKIKKFVVDNQYSFPVYQPDGYLPESLQVGSIPTTFVISAEGKIINKKVGTANYDTPKYKQFLEEGK